MHIYEHGRGRRPPLLHSTASESGVEPPVGRGRPAATLGGLYYYMFSWRVRTIRAHRHSDWHLEDDHREVTERRLA